MPNDSKEAGTMQEDARIRELALSITREITSKDGTTFTPDGKPERSYKEVEYVALIYRDGDQIKTTNIYTDNKTSETSLDRAIEEAKGANNVLAVVHNHPEAHVMITKISGNTSYDKALAANQLPSDEDWKTAKDHLFGKSEKDGRPEDRDGMLFIISPEGNLRGYDYEDRQKWLMQLNGPSVGANRGNPSLKASPIIEDPTLSAPAPVAPPTNPAAPDQASQESQRLFAQAFDSQLPSMQQYSADDKQRMFAHAVYLGAQRGWTGIEGVAPNNATEHHQAGEFLCVAGKSSSPDPAANGVAVPMENALKATPGEWLAQADTARQTLAQTQAQAQQLAQTQEQSQSVEQGMAHRRVL